MKWEYTVLYLDAISSEDAAKGLVYTNVFDKFGNEGWELVSVYDGFAYFKRPVKSNQQLEHYIEEFDYDDARLVNVTKF